MTDINLLRDTKAPNDDGESKKRADERIPWTAPKPEKPPEPTREPSRFGSLLRSFFARPPSPPAPHPRPVPHPPHVKPAQGPLAPVHTPGALPKPKPPAPPPAPPPPMQRPTIKQEEQPHRFVQTLPSQPPPAPGFPPAPPKPPVPMPKQFAPAPQDARPKILNEPIKPKASLGRGTILAQEEKGKKEREVAPVAGANDGRQELVRGGAGVNLLPEDFIVRFNPKKRLLEILLVGVVCAGLTGGALFALSWYELRIVEHRIEVQQDIATVERDIGGLRAMQQDAIAAKEAADAIRKLLGGHVRWTNFFAYLERYTTTDVYYTGGFSGTTAGALTLTAVGRSYTAVAQQLTAFQEAVRDKQFISSVDIAGAQKGASTDPNVSAGVSFSVSLQLLPDLFTSAEGPAAAEAKSASEGGP